MSFLKSTVPAAVLLMASVACASPGSPAGSRSTRSPDLIMQAEIQATQAGTAFELVNKLRPQWLRAPAVGSISGGSTQMQSTLVYLDNVRLGGLDALRTLSASGITSMRFLSADRAATVIQDVGRDPISGVILISTR